MRIKKPSTLLLGISQLSSQAPLLQSNVQRVEQLESQASQQRMLVEKFEDERQKQEDNETMRTIMIRGFRNPGGRSIRAKAHNVLSGIGCDSVLHSAQRVHFSNNNQVLRLTFPTPAVTQDATSWFPQSIKQVKMLVRIPEFPSMF